MKRGDFVTVALQGDLGKPRPALIIQTDAFENLKTVTVLPVTGSLIDAPLLRITLQPNKCNGLQKASQLMVDKTITVQREKLGQVIGRADGPTMIQVERALAVFLGVVCPVECMGQRHNQSPCRPPPSPLPKKPQRRKPISLHLSL